MTLGCRMDTLMNARGMWGLMAFPSSSTAAGAVPAFRAASRSFCLRNSSRDNFPGPTIEVRGVKLEKCHVCVPGPVPEAMMARVKDRLTKAGNTIVLKFRHVCWPKRVLSVILHHLSLLDDDPHRSPTHGCTGYSYRPAAGSAKVFASSSPTHRYAITLQERNVRLDDN